MEHINYNYQNQPDPIQCNYHKNQPTSNPSDLNDHSHFGVPDFPNSLPFGVTNLLLGGPIRFNHSSMGLRLMGLKDDGVGSGPGWHNIAKEKRPNPGYHGVWKQQQQQQPKKGYPPNFNIDTQNDGL